ncbi:MAG: efflux RND transporter permease subunit [Bacillota bacterium]
MHITELSVRRPAMMTMVILFFVVLGLYTFGKIGVELYPAVNTPYVSVSVSYPGAGAEEIETQIIKPLEDSLSSLGQLKNIMSTATTGRGTVILEFDLSVDADEVAIDVQKNVDNIRRRLPDGADDPVVIKRDINDSPVMTLSLGRPGARNETYDMANDIVKERLQRVKGVSEISIIGGMQREIQIEVDKSKMEGYGLTLNQVVSRLDAENLNEPTGRLDRPEGEYNVRVLGQFQSIQEIKQIQIPSPSGYAVPLEAIASVNDSFKEVRQVSRINGKEAVGIQIYKQSDASVTEVGDAVKEKLEEVKKELPTDCELLITNDSSDFVHRSLKGTWMNILEGIITTGLVLFIFLRQWRSTAIVMLAIPTSLLATVMMMYFAGFTFNMMSLMGLALCIGILVDDSIVVLENIHRHMKMGKTPWQAAIDGRKEIGMAAIAITLSDVVVFMPVAFMGGMVGQFFRQFGLTVVFATLFSLFVSFTLAPMMASRLYRQSEKEDTRQSIARAIWQKTIPLGEKAKDLYHRMLMWSLSNRKKVLVGSLAAFVLSLTSIPLGLVGMEFMPRSDQGQINVTLEMPVGTPIGETSAALKQMEKHLSEIPEVQYYQTTIGSGGGGSSNGANSGIIQLKLFPKDQREKSVWQVADGIRQWSTTFKQGKIRVSESESMVGGGPGGSAVRIVVSGKDHDKLVALSEQVRDIVARTPGANSANTDWTLGQPEVQIKVDHMRTAHYGLSVNDVSRTLRAAVNGESAGVYREGDKEIDMLVKLAGANKQDINDLQNLMVSGSGGAVSLGQVASVGLGSGPTDIRRENKQRSVTVTANVRSRPLGDFMADVKKEISKLDLPAGFTVNYTGQARSMNESFTELRSALLLSVILVYMVLVMLYESFTTPLIRMLSLPLGIVGALVALVWSGNNLNIFTFIGIIMLDGLVAKNGTLLIDYTHTLMAQGRSLKEALIEAGSTRLKPIIMTTLTMVIGMLPTALSLTDGAENRTGMAWVLIGGLISSTVFTLFVIPVVYTIIDDWKTKWRRRKDLQALPVPELTMQ